jgi:hypothetical protein
MTTSTPLATFAVTATGTLEVNCRDPFLTDHLWHQREQLTRLAEAQRLRLRHEDVDLWWYAPPLPRRGRRFGLTAA